MIPDKQWLEREGKEADQALNDYPPEYHQESCRNRHGVIRNVAKLDTNRVSRAINYYYGNKGQWWRNTPGKRGFMDVEFVHMTKAYPPPKEPWEWCGTSVLFPSHQKRAEITEELRSLYKIGQQVSFTYKGKRHTGLISSLGKRATVIVPDSGKWYIPFPELE
jgi:hypothetical protein